MEICKFSTALPYIYEHVLDQIRSKVVKKVRKTWHLKGKVVVLQTLEWKFKADIARNVIFEGH